LLVIGIPSKISGFTPGFFVFADPPQRTINRINFVRNTTVHESEKDEGHRSTRKVKSATEQNYCFIRGSLACGLAVSR